MANLTTSKDLLPEDWWAVAKCVDAYESESGSGFPDLRSFADRAVPEFRPAALVELVKVDLERRWNAGQRRVGGRLSAGLSGTSDGSDGFADIVQQEFLMRSKTGDQPSVNELASRFPKLDERRVLQSDEYLIKTLAFGGPTEQTQDFAAITTFAATGTVMFDSKRGSGSNPLQRRRAVTAARLAAPDRAVRSTSAPAVPHREWRARQHWNIVAFGVENGQYSRCIGRR